MSEIINTIFNHPIFLILIIVCVALKVLKINLKKWMNALLLVILLVSICGVLGFYDISELLQKISNNKVSNDNEGYEDIISLYDTNGTLTCLVSGEYFTYERKDQEFIAKFYLSGNLFYKEFSIPENSYKSYALLKDNIDYKWGDEYNENQGEYGVYEYSSLELLINGISTYKRLDNNLKYNCQVGVKGDVNFELPKNIEFSGDNGIIGGIKEKITNRYQEIPEIDTSNRKTYNNGIISFKYPSNLIISSKEWEDFNFNDSVNIHVKVYDFPSIFDDIIDNDLYWALMEDNTIDTIQYSKEKTQHYKEILNDIKDGKGVKSVSSKDFFDHFSSRRTAGAISAFPITVNGVNGLVVNYYFTQDPSAGCLSQFNTELMIVKDENTIISIMFKNNFGGVRNLLKPYGIDGEICIGENGDYKIAEDASNYIEKYYETGESLEGTKYQVFEENDAIINRIMHTVQLLK